MSALTIEECVCDPSVFLHGKAVALMDGVSLFSDLGHRGAIERINSYLRMLAALSDQRCDWRWTTVEGERRISLMTTGDLSRVRIAMCDIPLPPGLAIITIVES